MQVLGVVGPGHGDLLDDLVFRLEGRVARVERGAVTAPGPTATYRVDEDGGWSATGRGRSVRDVLDDLAATYDYALLGGFPGARVPTVVLGDAEAAGETVLAAPEAGAVDPAEAVEALEAAEPYVTLATLVERAKASPRADRAGAIATFTGRVRAKDAPDDERTEFLEFEKYEGVAAERLREIEADLEGREGVHAVHTHHRVGRIEDGEDIVFVVVLAGHRGEAFRAVEDGIDRLKTEVPIFKKEATTEEEFWVHEA